MTQPQPHCVPSVNSHPGKGWGRLNYRTLLWELNWLTSYSGSSENFRVGIQHQNLFCENAFLSNALTSELCKFHSSDRPLFFKLLKPASLHEMKE